MRWTAGSAALMLGVAGAVAVAAPAAERHLRAGYDKIVTTMQHLRGHTGNSRVDQAILENKDCDYITRLSLTETNAA